MSALFVAVNDNNWIQLEHIVRVVDDDFGNGCRLLLTNGERIFVNSSAKDFINRIESVT